MRERRAREERECKQRHIHNTHTHTLALNRNMIEIMRFMLFENKQTNKYTGTSMYTHEAKDFLPHSQKITHAIITTDSAWMFTWWFVVGKRVCVSGVANCLFLFITLHLSQSECVRAVAKQQKNILKIMFDKSSFQS